MARRVSRPDWLTRERICRKGNTDMTAGLDSTREWTQTDITSPSVSVFPPVGITESARLYHSLVYPRNYL